MVLSYEQLLDAAQRTDATFVVVPYEGTALAFPVNVHGPRDADPIYHNVIACIVAHQHLKEVTE